MKVWKMYVEYILSGDYAEIIPHMTKCEAKVASCGAVDAFIKSAIDEENTAEKYEILYFLKAFKLILTRKPKLVFARSLHSKNTHFGHSLPEAPGIYLSKEAQMPRISETS